MVARQGIPTTEQDSSSLLHGGGETKMVEPGSPRAVGAQQRDTSRAARSPRASFPITKNTRCEDKQTSPARVAARQSIRRAASRISKLAQGAAATVKIGRAGIKRGRDCLPRPRPSFNTITRTCARRYWNGQRSCRFRGSPIG